jgi:hypothetical protein
MEEAGFEVHGDASVLNRRVLGAATWEDTPEVLWLLTFLHLKLDLDIAEVVGEDGAANFLLSFVCSGAHPEVNSFAASCTYNVCVTAIEILALHGFLFNGLGRITIWCEDLEHGTASLDGS